jgi:hypothetical protein
MAYPESAAWWRALDAGADLVPRDAAALRAFLAAARFGARRAPRALRPRAGPPPPLLRTNRTRRVLHLVLIGHAASLRSARRGGGAERSLLSVAPRV